MGTHTRVPSYGAELIAALGLVFVLSGVTVWWVSVVPATDSIQAALHGLVMHVLFGVVVLALGIHTERSELEPTERFNVMGWCFAGFLFLVTLAVWGQLDELLTYGVSEAVVSDVVVFGSLGGAFGVIAGINGGRSSRNRALAERNEEQRETLVLLTRLLRHDIRNDLMAIRGHADCVADHVRSPGDASLEVIQRRSDSILRLLGDTNSLVQTLGDDQEFDTVDLSVILEEEAERVAKNHPAVTVRTAIPDGLRVVADGLIHQLFSNLLENAVAHNDPEGLTIRLEATRRGETIDVVVADDGDGIPSEIGQACFEMGRQGPDSEGDGLGLYLVSRLGDVYGGDVVLEEDAAGTTFRVSLPAAPRPDEPVSSVRARTGQGLRKMMASL